MSDDAKQPGSVVVSESDRIAVLAVMCRRLRRSLGDGQFFELLLNELLEQETQIIRLEVESMIWQSPSQKRTGKHSTPSNPAWNVDFVE